MIFCDVERGGAVRLGLPPDVAEGEIGGKFDVADQLGVLEIAPVDDSRGGSGAWSRLWTVFVGSDAVLSSIFCELKRQQGRYFMDYFSSVDLGSSGVVYKSQ